jgi:hypothetical protein
MIPKIRQDDFGFYAIRYYDAIGNVILPDWDGTLIWEFRDSASVLQFTGTTSSSPALVQDNDSDGDFVKVIDIPLTGWALGFVTVTAYAKKNAVNVEPYPMLATAFEITEQVDGYCTPTDVINYCGVTRNDLQQGSDNALRSLLGNWIQDADQIINEILNKNYDPPSTAPFSIRNASMRMVSNMVLLSVQRRRNPIVTIGEFTVELLQDIMLTDDIHKQILRNRTLKIGTAVYRGSDYEDEDEE